MSAAVQVKTMDLVPLACSAAFCPVCAQWKARAIFPGLRRHVVEVMGEEGCAMVCLESSEEGFSLYRRLGFREACLRQVYEPSQP
jgi:hypothetical protein